MKIVLYLFLFLLSVTAFGQTDSLDRRVNKLLQNAKTHQLSKDELKEVRTLATNIQNRGFILEERHRDYAGSLKEIDSALNVWHLLRDTANIANLFKYRGYLLGNLNRFSEAKTDIDSAILLFKSVDFPKGIAVSQFDLSRVYESELKLDSALKYAAITIPFWRAQKDTFRVVGSGNQVINLCLKMKKYDRALSMQQELIPLLAKKDLYWQDTIEFYFLSIQLFKKLNLADQQNKYERLYTEKKKVLYADGISPIIRYSPYP